MGTRAFAALFGLLLLGQAVAAPPTPEERYEAALTELKRHCDEFCGFGLGKDPADAIALRSLWSATQDWTVAFLNKHLGNTPEELENELINGHPESTESVRPNDITPLSVDLYAFSSQWGETGNVFLVGKRAGQWKLVWDISGASVGRFANLKSWHTSAARDSCRQTIAEGRGGECGPLHGSVYALAPDMQGSVRFLVRATYAQMMGATVGNQISFWRWNSKTAEPLKVEIYGVMADDGPDKITRDTAIFRVKDGYKMFFACGSCVGRQMDWTFRILPDRIGDLVQKPLNPEMDVVDEAFYLLWHRKDANALAAPTVLRKMRAIVEARKKDDSAWPSLGMIMGVEPTRRGAITLLDVATDNDDAPRMRFTIMHKKSGFYLTKLEFLPEK